MKTINAVAEYAVKGCVSLCTLVAVYAFVCAMLCCGCSSPAQEPAQNEPDAAPASCYPESGTVREACEWACGINERNYERSGGVDSGTYFNYTECLNECGCDQWPDGGNGQ